MSADTTHRFVVTNPNHVIFIEFSFTLNLLSTMNNSLDLYGDKTPILKAYYVAH